MRGRAARDAGPRRSSLLWSGRPKRESHVGPVRPRERGPLDAVALESLRQVTVGKGAVGAHDAPPRDWPTVESHHAGDLSGTTDTEVLRDRAVRRDASGRDPLDER